MSGQLCLRGEELQSAASQFTQASSTQTEGRSIPRVETYTASVREIISAYFEAAVIAGEALSDEANNASTEATKINTEASQTDTDLAQATERPHIGSGSATMATVE